MTKRAFLNGRVYDPSSGQFAVQNLLIIGKKLVGMGYLPEEDADAQSIELTGCLVLPNVATIPKDRSQLDFASLGCRAFELGQVVTFLVLDATSLEDRHTVFEGELL